MRTLRSRTFSVLVALVLVLTGVASAQITTELLTTAAETDSPGGTAGPGFIFNAWYHDHRHEAIYLASDLLAAGIPPGAQISAVQVKPSQTPAQDMLQYRVRAEFTTATALTTTPTVMAANTLKYGPTNITASSIVPNTWFNFPFASNMGVWNGTDNLRLDFTNDNSSYTTDGGVKLRATGANRARTAYSDSGFVWPYDSMTGTNQSTVPSLKVTYLPPALTVIFQNIPFAREGQPYSASPYAVEFPVYLPYTWQLTPISNASWLTVTAGANGTCTLSGTPPSNAAGTATFSLKVTNSKPTPDTDTKTFSITVYGVPSIVPQFTENFELSTAMNQYDMSGGVKSHYALSTNASAAPGAKGLVMDSTEASSVFGTTASPIDVDNAAQRAILDDPSQWGTGGSLAIQIPAYIGEMRLTTKAYGVQSVNVSFDLKIVRQYNGTVTNPNYYMGMCFEYSQDAVTWTVAKGGTGMNSSGIYRVPIATPTNTSFTLTGFPGTATQRLYFRFRWYSRLKENNGGIDMYFGMDNFKLTVPFTITTLSLPSATALIPYAYENGTVALSQVSGIAPVVWSSTNKPAWMTLNASTALITGTPATSDVGTSAIDFTALDSTNAAATRNIPFEVKTAPSALSITNLAALPAAAEQQFYQYSLSAFGGAPIQYGTTNPRYYWSITTDASSSWLTMDANTGLLHGTPPSGSLGTTATFIANVHDGMFGMPAAGAWNQASGTFTLAVVQQLTVTSPSLALARVGSTYRPAVSAAGGVDPYTWQIISGALPNGLTFDPNSGLIVGVPLVGANGIYNITFLVSDTGNQTSTATLSLVVQAAVATNALALTTTALTPNTATETEAYEAWLDAEQGTPPYTWGIAVGSPDQLPAGLTLDQFGRVSGSPFNGTARQYTLKFQVQDANLVQSTATLLLDVKGLISSPVLTTQVMQDGQVGVSYPPSINQPANSNDPGFHVSGGSAPYTWQMTGGTLPVGLSFSPVGLISGVPKAGAEENSPYSVTLRVTDANGNSASQNFTFAIAAFTGAPLNVVVQTLPSCTEGNYYSFRINATGGANPTASTTPYTFRRSLGTLPTGVDLDAFGQLKGVPADGTHQDLPYNFTVEVTDPAGFVSQAPMSLTVLAPLITGGGTTITTGPSTVKGGGSACSLAENSSGWWMLAAMGGMVAMFWFRRRAAAR